MAECLNSNRDCIAKMVTFEEINRLIPKYLRKNAWKKTQSFWESPKRNLPKHVQKSLGFIDQVIDS